MLAGCQRHEREVASPDVDQQSAKALPGVRIEQFDPAQLANLGPAASPSGVIASSTDLSVLRRKALEGDSSAAFRVMQHFNAVGNPSQAVVWARIGAENGEYNSMRWMAFDYGQKDGLENCLRAVYWLARAKEELEGGLKSPDLTKIQEGLARIQIEAGDEELARLRKRTSGC